MSRPVKAGSAEAQGGQDLSGLYNPGIARLQCQRHPVQAPLRVQKRLEHCGALTGNELACPVAARLLNVAGCGGVRANQGKDSEPPLGCVDELADVVTGLDDDCAELTSGVGEELAVPGDAGGAVSFWFVDHPLAARRLGRRGRHGQLTARLRRPVRRCGRQVDLSDLFAAASRR